MNRERWIELINKHNPKEDDLCDLLEKAYQMGVEDGVIEESHYDDMASAVGLFIAQCGEMAEENWCPSQVDMLKRLFGAVLKGCEYAEYEMEEGE